MLTWHHAQAGIGNSDISNNDFWRIPRIPPSPGFGLAPGTTPCSALRRPRENLVRAGSHSPLARLQRPDRCTRATQIMESQLEPAGLNKFTLL
jgi:hypothetical protein